MRLAQDDMDELRRAVTAAHSGGQGGTIRDPEHAVALWQALVRGAYRRIDDFHVGSHRFIVAMLDRAPRLVALAPRERAVVRRAARGLSDKAIAFDLGLAKSTVATLLGRALRKLGLSRLDLARLDWAGSVEESLK